MLNVVCESLVCVKNSHTQSVCLCGCHLQPGVTSRARASVLVTPGAAHALPRLILPGSYPTLAGKKSGGSSGALL